MSARPLRILTVANVPPDPDSGAAGTVYATNVALREIGHEVDEIWAEHLLPRRLVHGNLHSLFEQPRSYRREVLKAVAAKPYDAVMISQPQGWMAARELRRQNFPGVVVNRSHGVELRADAALNEWHQKLGVPASRFPWGTRMLQSLLQRQWPLAVRYSDGVVVPSNADRDCLLSDVHGPPEKVRCIHHGVSERFSSAERMVKTKRHGVLYVGQHSFIKGPMIVADVFNQILSRFPEQTATWVTSKTAHPQIRSLLEDKIAHRVQLLDWMQNESLLEHYDSSALFLFPSFMEGAGKAALEAMSRGLCVVSSATGGMVDYIRHGHSGLLCPVGNASAFVSEVTRALSTGNWQAMGEKASQFAKTKTWERTASELADFFRELQSRSVASIL